MNEHYPRSIEEVRRHFDFFDDDASGFIDFDEFQDMLRILGMTSSIKDSAENFSKIDTDSDGRVSFDEFFSWWKNAFYTDK